MGKLRMKETASDKQYEQEREHRKKRRRREERKDCADDDKKASSSSRARSTSTDFDGTKYTGDDSDAYVPPRPSKDRPYVPYSYNDEDEEGKLPPPQSEKRDTTLDDETFHHRLFEAMREDERGDVFDSSAREAGFGFDYREALPDRRAFGRSTVMNDRYVDPDTGIVVNRVIFKDAMTEEEYANHIRGGMYRRTRKEEIARQERLVEERKAKEQKKFEDFQRMQEMEMERQRKLEERARRKNTEGATKSREAYQAAWARLVDPKRQAERLSMEDYPWPHLSESGEMTAESVERFLLDHLSDIEDVQEMEKKKKQAIRTAVLAYHPDRFERYVQRAKKESDKESIRQMGLRVSQILNEILNVMK